MMPKDPIQKEIYIQNLRELRLGKTASEETKKKLSIARSGDKNPNYGKRHSQETLERISNSIKKKFKQDPSCVERMKRTKTGKTLDLITRKRMSESHYRRYENTPTLRYKRVEEHYGGFWYGNVRYYDGPQYCEKFNKEFKERVRAYWNYQCFECGTPQNGRLLGVHHVHYDKKMCCNGSPQDVVPLCASCHSKTNKNRDYWEDHFTELLYAYNPDGKCFFTKEEYKEFKKSSSPFPQEE